MHQPIEVNVCKMTHFNVTTVSNPLHTGKVVEADVTVCDGGGGNNYLYFYPATVKIRNQDEKYRHV